MALKLYMNTIRVVLDINSANENSWSRIYGSLSCLRQSLLCAACQKLLAVPQRPVDAECEHSYCKRCIKRRKGLCKWCNGKEFEDHTRLRIILQCYKKMCRYIMASGICRCWDSTDLTSPMVRFVSMVCEGAELEDRYHHVYNTVTGPLAKKPKPVPSTSSEGEHSKSVKSSTQVYTMKADNNALKIKLPRVGTNKSATSDKILTVYPIPDPSSEDSEIEYPKGIAKCLKSVKKRRTCRCCMSSQQPGNVTCFGQRCPCYVNGRACINCRCVGCKNPQKNIISSPPCHSGHHHRVRKVSKKAFAASDKSSSSAKAPCANSKKDTSD